MAFEFETAVEAPFRMQPGLRRLAADAPLLTPVHAGRRGNQRHLREKLAVLGGYAPQALLHAPGFDAAPALEALAQHASTEHPSAFALDGGFWRAPQLGWSVDAAGGVRDDDRALGDRIDQHHGRRHEGDAIGAPPSNAWPEVGRVLHSLPPHQRRAALLSLAFADDFAVIDGKTTTIPWLAVALPSHWRPEDKVGRPFAEVHAPVADNRLIVGAASHLSRLVTGRERWERFVWTVTPHARLHAHPDRVDRDGWQADDDADRLAAGAFFRSERQAFLPVEGARQAVFAIHVETAPLAEVANTPDRARRLAASIASMSDAVLVYRGLDRARDRMLEWLGRRARG